MRLFLIAAAVAAAAASGIPVFMTIPASAAECTGANCPPPAGQGGHDCEGKKQEQTTS